MTASPFTLTHSDYRLVNMLLGGSEGERRVTVLDWQRVALGKGPIDVAFFTVLSLEPETRRAWQWDLVERYHAGLLEHGVRDYSLEECQRDYRLCAFAPSRIALAHGSRPRRNWTGPRACCCRRRWWRGLPLRWKTWTWRSSCRLGDRRPSTSSGRAE